jgi:uncharacterized protein involved in type VI secretion and phage assembly
MFGELTPTVLVEGSPISPDDQRALIEVAIDLQLNLPGRGLIRYAALDIGEIRHPTQPGTAVTVRVEDRTLFAGELVAAEVEYCSEPEPTVTLVAYDLANRLSFTAHTDTFQRMSAKAILSKIASGAGLSLKAEGVPGEAMEYVLQAGTDLEMLDMVTRRVGVDWWMSGGDLMVAALSTSSPVAARIPVKELHRFAARASANRPEAVVVRGWDSVQQRSVEGRATRREASSPAEGGVVDRYVGGSHAKGEHQVSSLPVESVKEAQTLAKALISRGIAGAVHAEGEGIGLHVLELGKVLEVTEGGSLSGKYVVTALQHRWSPQQALVSRFVAGDRRPRGIAPAPEDHEEIGTHHGVVVGEVTNINDPDERGRVRVRFLGLATDQESNWARVLSVGAGKDRGTVWLPEVGDEVLVGFEGGDLRHPVVLGGLYGSTKTIPIWRVKDGMVLARRSTSRLGHYIELGDGTSADAQHVLLSLQDGRTKLRLGKDEVELRCPDNVPLTIQAGGQSSIAFDGKGKVVLKGTQIEIQATSKVVVKGATVEATSSGPMKVSSSSSLELVGNGTAKLNSSGVLQVRGSIVQIN